VYEEDEEFIEHQTGTDNEILDVYNDEGELLEEDEISAEEAGFMQGYVHDDAVV
jgi:hypothetical protein